MKLTTIINEAPLSDSDWQLISRYGVYGNKQGRQKVSRAAVAAMVAAFNDEAAAKGSRWRGVPVFVGHPDVEPEKYPEKRRHGTIKEVQAREDGLYGRVSWNTLGKENVEQGYYVYPSAAWEFADNGDGSITPTKLISVGLTNRPNMEDVPAWTNEADDSDTPAANIDPEAAPDLAPILTALSLPDTADVPAIVEAINNLLAAKTSAETDCTNEKARADKAAEDMRVAVNAAQRDALIAVAINEGRVTEGQRAEVEAAFTTDFTKAAAELKVRPVVINTRQVEINREKARLAIASTAEKQAYLQTAVNERMSQHGEDYTTAYCAVKRLRPELFTGAKG